MAQDRQRDRAALPRRRSGAAGAGDRRRATAARSSTGSSTIRRYLREHARPGLRAYVTGPGGIAADLEGSPTKPAARCWSPPSASSSCSCCSSTGRRSWPCCPCSRRPRLPGRDRDRLPADRGGLDHGQRRGDDALLVLIFGAGTDYSLLLVHRYREGSWCRRVRRVPAVTNWGRSCRDPPDPARQCFEGEPTGDLAASGGTVIAAMLVLLVAEPRVDPLARPGPGDRDRGDAGRRLHPPPGPARDPRRPRAFWPTLPARAAGQGRPRRNLPNRDGGDPPAPRPTTWERAADLVRRRSGLLILLVVGLLVVLSLGNFTTHESLGFGQGETKPTNSSRGTEALERTLPRRARLAADARSSRPRRRRRRWRR